VPIRDGGFEVADAAEMASGQGEDGAQESAAGADALGYDGCEVALLVTEVELAKGVNLLHTG
jgi:hypothetical protein